MPREPGDELAHAAGRGARQHPGPAVDICIGAAQCGQAGSDVGDVVIGVHRVGIDRQPHRLAGKRRWPEMVAHEGGDAAGAVEVGRASCRGQHVAALVRREQQFGHPRPHLALAAAGRHRAVLVELASLRTPQHVDVVQRHQTCLCASCCGDQVAHQARQHVGPDGGIVGRVHAVVHRVRAFGCTRAKGRVGGVAGHCLGAGRDALRRTPGDAHPLARFQQELRQGLSDLSGAEQHMKFIVHRSFPMIRCPRRAIVAARSPRRATRRSIALPVRKRGSQP
ncbi:hypothetical protein GALL_466920 [mine drainage metagenome]|uniref:Uncharacterized protein n=1 Tax=mine drainage metagenome TaxID=410659 RepID=A0A1J5PVB1_9ZZZZ